MIEKSRKQMMFSGLKSNQTRMSLHPSFIQTITVGLGVPPSHAHLVILSGREGSARGLYHRSGITPCPEGFYLVVVIISQFAFTMQSMEQTLCLSYINCALIFSAVSL